MVSVVLSALIVIVTVVVFFIYQGGYTIKTIVNRKRLTEAFFVEINLHNKKEWLISCSCNPKKASITNHLSTLSKCTNIYTSKYDNLIFLGDFNAGVEDTDIKNFCSSYNLTSMVNKATCYKNPDKPTCIDLILTNCPGSFQNSCVVETGLSDFHNHSYEDLLSKKPT